jgi:hypothetical protein
MRLPQRALPTVLLTTLLLCFCGNLQADIVQYTFTGQIPLDPTENTHSEIENGEFWEANFLVDLNTPNQSLDGLYPNALISGSLSFSGGFTAHFDFFNTSDLQVLNDFDLVIMEEPFDFIQIREANTGEAFVWVAFLTTDLSFLTSDALPGPGTSGSPMPPTYDAALFQLFYADFTGAVQYTTQAANNVTFSASAIPEPSSFLAILLMTMSVTMRRRK